MALDPETLIGRSVGQYKIRTLIGSGAFAWVFEAEGEGGERVAVKVLRPRYSGDPQFDTRFRNEFQVASELRHPNVIRILDVGQAGEITYFAMDYCPESLASRVQREGPVPEKELLLIASQVCQALRFAHDAGFIHRDIKPDNILFTTAGRAVLADFGIAKAVSGFVAATGANMTIGTPHYLSPEQAQGGTLDGRTDLYSLGVTLYNASTGQLPFRSTDWFELARMHVEEAPKTPRALRSDISERLERIILKLMAKHPDDRYQSAEELDNDLNEIQRESRATATFGSPSTSAPVQEVARRRKWLRRVAGIIVVVLVAILVIVVGSR